MLGSNPPSLNWDEASTGYNAYSILKTGKDEYGNFLPVSIRSFDDYKPPLYTYLTVPFIGILGLTDTAVRLPSAILGTLSIIFIYFLILELFPKNKKREGFDISNFGEETALVGAFLFAISPWSLQFSRSAYEGNIGLFFLLGGLVFFLFSLKKSKYLLLSSVFFVLSMYSYHSFRLVVPLILILIAALFYQQLFKIKKAVVFSVVIFAFLVIPIFYSLVLSSSGTGSRLSMVTLFGSSPNLDHSIKQLEQDKLHNDIIGEALHNRRVVYFLAVTKGYLDHYNPDFLFLHGDGGRQHHAVDMGMLYLLELPLILLGLVLLSKNLNRRVLLLFGFMLIAPLPSAITTGTPHPVRAIAMLPGFIIFSSVGLVFLVNLILKSKVKYVIFTGFILLFVLNMTYYFHQYYVHTPFEYGDFWQYGYKQAFAYAKEHESKYNKIIVTYEYDQPYIYYLYYNQIDPAWYQKNWNTNGDDTVQRFYRKIGIYEFEKINWGKVSQQKNILVMGSPGEIPDSKEVLYEVQFPNGVTAFKIVETQ